MQCSGTCIIILGLDSLQCMLGLQQLVVQIIQRIDHYEFRIKELWVGSRFHGFSLEKCQCCCFHFVGDRTTEGWL